MTSRLLSGPARLTVAIALTIERLDRGDAEYRMRLPRRESGASRQHEQDGNG